MLKSYGVSATPVAVVQTTEPKIYGRLAAPNLAQVSVEQKYIATNDAIQLLNEFDTACLLDYLLELVKNETVLDKLDAWIRAVPQERLQPTTADYEHLRGEVQKMSAIDVAGMLSHVLYHCKNYPELIDAFSTRLKQPRTPAIKHAPGKRIVSLEELQEKDALANSYAGRKQ